MANRRLAKGSRALHRKKLKAAKKNSTSGHAKAPTSVLTTRSSATRKSFYTAAGTGLRGNSKTNRSSGSGNRGYLKLSARLMAKAHERERKIDAVRKARSQLRKQQQAERMTLKEHVAELERRRVSIRKGDGAKQERRELGKYIRQLKEEQDAKHAAELAKVETELQRLMDEDEQEHNRAQPPKKTRGANGYQANEEDGSGEEWVDVPDTDSDDSVDEAGLQDMFAHLIA